MGEITTEGLLAFKVRQQLMDYILHEHISVGEKLPPELTLAQVFGVGRSTVREAIKTLETEGILDVRRGSGSYVKRFTSIVKDPLGVSGLEDKYRLALELFDVRLMIEPDIARMAALNMKDDQKATLLRLCNETEELYLSGKSHASKDIEFHTCIAQGSGNRVVALLVPIIQTAIATFVNLTERRLKEETISTHREITDCILRSDATGAQCATIMHLNYNRMLLVKLQATQPIDDTGTIDDSLEDHNG